MSRSQKFPVAVHILVVLAHFRDRSISSEQLAGSIATNPVVVRRIMQALKKSGLVVSQGGMYGGARLARPADDINLGDVYQAVEGQESCQMHDPSPKCTIAQTIKTVVPEILCEVEAARQRELARFTIADLLQRVETEIQACVDEETA